MKGAILRQFKKRKSSVKYKPAGGITMSAGRANRDGSFIFWLSKGGDAMTYWVSPWIRHWSLHTVWNVQPSLYREAVINELYACSPCHLCTQADGIRGIGFFTSVCLSVCLSGYLFFSTISRKPMQLGSPNLTYKCSTMSHGNPFILGSKDQNVKGQGYESQNYCRCWSLHSCECWVLLVSSCKCALHCSTAS